ncbi:hypothetical protein [Filobacillus milosensis]|nr:hypothetical protein [Filobacillus milosensis]
MVATSTIISLSMLVISLVTGAFFYYVISVQTTKEKKEDLETVSSFFINFIILIWVGKITLNLSLFIEDPIAILAYPSQSDAFYFAFFASIFLYGYKFYKNELVVRRFVYVIVSIFIFSSFIYEFIDLVWQENTYTWRYLSLLFFLLVIYSLMSNQWSYRLISSVIIMLWGSGQIVLSLTQPFTTVFGYLISVWFICLIILIGIFLLLNKE